MNGPKFSLGDYFKVSATGRQGEVRHRFGMIKQIQARSRGLSYGVIWSHIHPTRVVHYDAVEVDGIWEKALEAEYVAGMPLSKTSVPDFTVTLPPGVAVATICDHHFTPYIGFREAFNFCTKCDEKQEIPK